MFKRSVSFLFCCLVGVSFAQPRRRAEERVAGEEIQSIHRELKQIPRDLSEVYLDELEAKLLKLNKRLQALAKYAPVRRSSAMHSTVVRMRNELQKHFVAIVKERDEREEAEMASVFEVPEEKQEAGRGQKLTPEEMRRIREEEVTEEEKLVFFTEARLKPLYDRGPAYEGETRTWEEIIGKRWKELDEYEKNLFALEVGIYRPGMDRRIMRRWFHGMDREKLEDIIQRIKDAEERGDAGTVRRLSDTLRRDFNNSGKQGKRRAPIPQFRGPPAQ